MIFYEYLIIEKSNPNKANFSYKTEISSYSVFYLNISRTNLGSETKNSAFNDYIAFFQPLDCFLATKKNHFMIRGGHVCEKKVKQQQSNQDQFSLKDLIISKRKRIQINLNKFLFLQENCFIFLNSSDHFKSVYKKNGISFFCPF